MRLAEVYRTRRSDLEENAGKLTDALRDAGASAAGGDDLDQGVIARAADDLRNRFDSQWGGFGGAPKFPPSMAIMLLLREWRRKGEKDLLYMAEFTLQRMALGGMYDQAGGGFHRYSVDVQWLVPHFEKMLYDNALLTRVYLEAFQATGNAFYKSIVTDTLDYVLREMTSPEGGFYSAQDADSEGEEGKFFVWTPAEVAELLDAEDARLFCKFYGVTESGNFEGKNILHVAQPPQKFCEEEGIEAADLLRLLERGRKKLFYARKKRVPPGLDDKILTSWNGLMIGSMAQGGRITEVPAYLDAARKAADFVLTRMRDGRGLLRTHRAGVSKLNAYLDDYAFMIVGLVDLYEASFEKRWLDEASALAREMVDRFWDDEDGGFYFTANDHEKLIVRKKMAQDGAIPAGNSMAAYGLLRLGKLTGDEAFSSRAREVIRAFGGYLEKAPAAFHMMLVALDFMLDKPVEIAVVGDPESPGTREALRAISGAFVPNKVLAFSDGADGESGVPLLRGKTAVDGAAAVYLCENFTCREPLTDPVAVKAALRASHQK